MTVNSKIYYHAQGKELSLTFSEEEAKQTAFKRRGSGYALITRRASVMRFQVRQTGRGGWQQSPWRDGSACRVDILLFCDPFFPRLLSSRSPRIFLDPAASEARSSTPFPSRSCR